jgi:hypothetical protein
MKKVSLVLITLLIVMTALTYAQTALDGGRSSGETGNKEPIRERIAPSTRTPLKTSDPARASGIYLPWSLLEPPQRFLWGDLDSDGLKDLLVLDMKGNLLFRNLGKNGFEEVTNLAFPDGAGCGVTGLIGDYDGDEQPDLFLFLEGGFTLLRNEGNFRFSDVTETLGLDLKFPVRNVKLEDIDGDGHDDLLVQTPAGDRIYRNREGWSFSEVSLPGSRSRGGPSALSDKTESEGGHVPPGSTAGPPDGMLTLDVIFVNDNSPGSVGAGIPEVEGGSDQLKPQNDIVDGTIAGADLEVPFKLSGSSAEAILSSTNDSGTNNNIAMHGKSTSGKGGAGVLGEGYFGVHGITESGRGVYGHAGNATGANYGVYGYSESSEGQGVHGFANAASGDTAGVYGKCNSEDGSGVYGEGPIYGVSGKATASSSWNWGVQGVTESTKGHGVSGYASSLTGNTFGVMGRSDSEEGKGIYGYAYAASGENYGVLAQTNSPDGYGVYGEAKATSGYAKGVFGTTAAYNGTGVYGESTTTSGTSYGVYGENTSGVGAGVRGTSPGIGVWGYSTGSDGKGVYGACFQSGGIGVRGNGFEYGVLGSGGSSGTTYGVFGTTNSDGGFGVRGESPVFAVYGKATKTSGVSWGVYGQSAAPLGFGVYGVAPKYGVYGYATDPGGYGGYFVGRASTDVLEIRGGSDLSERFDVRGAKEEVSPAPGMVVCIDPEQAGNLLVSSTAYDRTVAGIISGAGGIRTGMLMGQEDSVADGKNPVALTGRVYCLADASSDAIVPGDLLTTSDTPGHAMKVADHAKAQGAILGKAMSSLKEGKGLVLVLVTLQ